MIGIIDYGAGNTASVSYALEKFGVDFIVTNDISKLEEVEKIIFPGVGAAEAAMAKLVSYNLISLLRTTKKPVLGICLGMQMYSKHSEEGSIECLGIIEENCVKFPANEIKVPHMGWNSVEFREGSPLFEGIPQNSYFYFAHSYYIPENKYEIASCANGVKFCAALNKDNYYGVQFHPEKSSTVGLKVLKNFTEIVN